MTSKKSSEMLHQDMTTLREGFVMYCKLLGLRQSTCKALILLLNSKELLIAIMKFMAKIDADGLQKDMDLEDITTIVVVPTSFNSVTEEEFKERGVNVVIYANQLTRSGFPAMKNTAEMILKNHRAMEADAQCMPIKEILTLIPDKCAIIIKITLIF